MNEDDTKTIEKAYNDGKSAGFALAMEDVEGIRKQLLAQCKITHELLDEKNELKEAAQVLVECLKVVGNYLYFMGDELTGDDFVGDGALTKRYNEKLNLIEQALKEFKSKVGE